MNSMTRVAIGVVLGVAGTTGAQDRTKCATCRFITEQDFCTTFSSTITILNCEVIVGANGIAAGFAAEYEKSFLSKSPACNPEEPRRVTMSSGFRNGPTYQSDIMVNRSLSVGGAASDPQVDCGNSFGLVANLNSGNGGACRISSSVSKRDNYLFEVINTIATPLVQSGTAFNGRYGAASASASIEIEALQAIQFTGEVHANAEVIEEFVDTCIESLPAKNDGQPESELLIGAYYRFSVDGVTGAAGLLAVKPGLQYIRLGIFADPAFTELLAGNSSTLNGTVAFQFSSQAGGELLLDESWMSYSTAIGDVNGDGYITFCDRDLLLPMNGAVIGDSVYDPRGDMDVDGDIDADDLARAEIEFARAVSNYNCRGDYNGDGSLNIYDMSSMLDDYNAQSPRADIDCNGIHNYLDISLFLTDYAAGCS